MPWNNPDLPAFGPLQGVKAVFAATSVAGPVAMQLLADFGADVIWIENPGAPDVCRATRNYAIEVDRRNMRNLALNTTTPEGKQAFLELIEDADVFLEASKGGQWDRFGLGDDVLWEHNPKLVICHVTGFGVSGLPGYVKRASFDATAQAFSGYIWNNRPAQGAPNAVGPYTADYMTTLFAAFGIVSALYRARETGQGESIDVAQYEVMARVMYDSALYFTDGVEKPSATADSPFAGWGVYTCKDGTFLQLCLIGAGVIKRACELFGLPYGTEDIPAGQGILMRSSRGGAAYEDAIRTYISSKTGAEAIAEMEARGLAVQKVNNLEDYRNDPHVKARGSLVQETSITGKQITRPRSVPVLKNNPAQTWCPAPKQGQDNEAVLGQLGYGPDQIKAMYDNGTLIQRDTM